MQIGVVGDRKKTVFAGVSYNEARRQPLGNAYKETGR